MARIPVGNFGFSGPQSVQASNINPRVRSNVMDVWEQAGQDAERASARVSAVFERKAAEEKEIKQMEAATGVMKYQMQLKQVRSDLERQYDEGTLSWDAMDNAWQQAKEKIEKPVADVNDPIFQERMNLQLQQHDMEADDAWNNISSRARKGAMQAATIGAVDEMYKANIDNPKMVEQYLSSPEFEQKGRMAFGEEWPLRRTAMIEGAYTNSYTERVIAAGDNVGALQQLRNELDSDEVKMRLDPQKRLSLVSGISSTIDRENEQAQRRAEAAALKAESAAFKTYERWDTHVQSGKTIPASEIPGIIESTKGTSMEGSVQNLIASQNEVQKVLDAPADQRNAFMLSIREQMQKEGSTPEQEERYKRLESAIRNREEMEKQDPQSVYEMKTGEKEINVDWGADTLQLALSERKQRADAMGNDTILKPAEKKALVETFNKADATDKMKQLKQLQSRLEPDTYKMVVSELGKEKEFATLAFTGILAGQGKDEDALLILKGDEIEKAGATGYMSKSEFAKSLDSNFYSAFAGNEVARENAIDMAYKRYLAKGTAGEGAKEDTDSVTASVNAVVGQTPVVGRRATIMPQGMEEEQFIDTIQARFEAEKEKRGLLGEWDDYEYTAITDKKTGRMVYRIDIDGAPVTDQPIYLDVQ